MLGSSRCITQSQVDLINNLRMLWEQHIFWTRLVIISMVSGLADVDAVTNQLLKNPGVFETALKPLYGEQIAARFADLLKDHLIIAAQLVKAAIAGDNRAAAEYERRWYENADDLAAFIASINPYWSVRDWRTMLHEHLRQTKNEAVDMIKKNYADGITVFGDIEKGALQMADTMAQGIIKQFPLKFAV